MSRVYSFKEYDRYICLKPGAGFWLICVFFLRPYLLKLSTFQPGQGSGTVAVSKLFELVYPDDFVFFLAMIASLPVILLCGALMKRKPGAKEPVRMIWRNGAKLLALTAILNVIVIFIPVIIGRAHGIHPLDIAQLIVTALIFFYILRSVRLRDTFADFPLGSPADTGKR